MSAIRSEIPDAVVVGDYAVEIDEVLALNDEIIGNSDGSSSLWTTLVLGPIMGSRMRSSREESRELEVEPSTAHAGRRRRQRYLWMRSSWVYSMMMVVLSLMMMMMMSMIMTTEIIILVSSEDAYIVMMVLLHVHPGGNDNHDGNTIQRVIEDANVEDTDAYNSSDGVGHYDEFVFGDDNDDYVNNTRVLRRRLDSHGTFLCVRHPGGNDNHDGNTI